MSQVTEQSVRFQTALASIKLIQASAVLDLTEDDFDFLTSNKDRKSGSAGMPRPISYAVFCLKKKKKSIITSSFGSLMCPILKMPSAPGVLVCNSHCSVYSTSEVTTHK